MQKSFGFLLKIVKTGTTLVRTEKVLIRRLRLPYVCKQIAEHLEVGATNRPVTLLSWDNPALTSIRYSHLWSPLRRAARFGR